ncbi:putative serine protease K12H4.7 [Elephas maximus indicus]|uniref:putative serine protease K12H4.7 n=1 Tax=Elephas maximus indicus TaxID=99487 RepID=UPI0021165B50|nr:putative serine protease K12H4.7 [Elephas maximus indicus]
MAQALGWLLLLLFCSSAPSFLWRQPHGSYSSNRMHPSRAGSFRQKLDHFSKISSRLWPQRYFINDAFYKPGGPVFLRIGGSRTVYESWISINNTWVTYAERVGALLLLLEHRFYGHSQPTGDLSTPSLHYLSSRQALADIANFRTQIAEKMGLTENKWVAFGCSYAGSLAAWSRIKHPELFAAAVGSSAPIKAKANFYEYLEVVQRSLATHNRKCFQAVKEAFGEVRKMLRSRKYHSKLEYDFRLCKPMKFYSAMDKAFFLELLVFPLKSAVQNNRNEKNYKGEQLSFSMDELCVMMADISLGSPYYRYIRITHLLFKHEYSRCFPAHYREKLEVLLDSSIDHHNPTTDRQLFYQSCTEFGFFQTTDSKKQTFTGLPLSYFVQQCSDFFGPKFNHDSLNTGVISTNAYYGGLNVTGSKIIFPNGSFDPWHPLGITKGISKDLPAVFIKGAVHCADMYEQKNTDSAELIQAREKIFRILQKWLKQ